MMVSGKFGVERRKCGSEGEVECMLDYSCVYDDYYCFWFMVIFCNMVRLELMIRC